MRSSNAILLLQVQTETILLTPRYAQEHVTDTGSSTTFQTRSIYSTYIGTGGQDTDTHPQVPIVQKFSVNASATIRLTAALDRRICSINNQSTEIHKLVSQMAG